MREFDKIPKRSEGRIDGVIIRDVVAVVFARRFLERHQPDRGYAQAAEIVEPAHQALEIADAVGVRIHVSGDRQTVKTEFLYQRSLIIRRARSLLKCSKALKPGHSKSSVAVGVGKRLRTSVSTRRGWPGHRRAKARRSSNGYARPGQTLSSFRGASQRVRAKRGPMTGSAE